MSEEPKKGLSVDELLEQTYALLLERNEHKTVEFNDPARPEYGSSWDPCRGTEIYRLTYKQVDICTFGKKTYALGLNGWLIAVETKKENEKDLPKQIEENFKENVLLYSDNGQLAVVSWSKHGTQLRNALRQRISTYLVHDVFRSELVVPQRDYAGRELYEPTFVHVVAAVIENELREW